MDAAATGGVNNRGESRVFDHDAVTLREMSPCSAESHVTHVKRPGDVTAKTSLKCSQCKGSGSEE